MSAVPRASLQGIDTSLLHFTIQSQRQVANPQNQSIPKWEFTICFSGSDQQVPMRIAAKSYERALQILEATGVQFSRLNFAERTQVFSKGYIIPPSSFTKDDKTGHLTWSDTFAHAALGKKKVPVQTMTKESLEQIKAMVLGLTAANGDIYTIDDGRQIPTAALRITPLNA